MAGNGLTGVNKKTEEFLEMIFASNPRQKESILYTMDKYFTEDDYSQLEDILGFYSKSMSITEIADAYRLLIEDTIQETMYFLEHGRYRYSSFEETERLVYSRREYMSKYMVGLSVSGYLWSNHIRMFHWFRDIMKGMKGARYLEIGPGHGRYFCESVEINGFSAYDAIDVSETSVNQTCAYLKEHLDKEKMDKCRVFKKNAYDHKPSEKYDFVVIAEVLEHLEDPLGMLSHVSSISSDKAYLYVTVPVNAPEIDHIFLFNSIEEVEELVKAAGFGIKDRLYAAAGDMKLEKAVKKKNSILVGLLAEKV